MSSPTATEPVYLDWEGILAQRFDLLRDAIRRNEAGLLSAIEVHDRLRHVDHAATFRKEARALQPAASNEADRPIRDLEDVLTSSVETLKKHCEGITKKMKDLAASPEAQNPDAWKKLLTESSGTVKEKTDEVLDDANKRIIQLIKRLPSNLRNPAARAAGQAANSIAGFGYKASTWLRQAADTVPSWIRDYSKIIEDWDRLVRSLSETILDQIKNSFSDDLVGHLSGFITRANLAAKEDFASPENMDWPSGYVVVRKGNCWLVEPM